MIDRIGQGNSLARAAIEAALARQAELAHQAQALPTGPQALAGAGGLQGADFAGTLGAGIRSVNADVARADRLAEDVVSGKIVDFHEAAAVLKQSELSLKFALEVRNKFVDAYREIMRMSV